MQFHGSLIYNLRRQAGEMGKKYHSVISRV